MANRADRHLSDGGCGEQKGEAQIEIGCSHREAITYFLFPGTVLKLLPGVKYKGRLTIATALGRLALGFGQRAQERPGKRS